MVSQNFRWLTGAVISKFHVDTNVVWAIITKYKISPVLKYSYMLPFGFNNSIVAAPSNMIKDEG